MRQLVGRVTMVAAYDLYNLMQTPVVIAFIIGLTN